MKGSDNIIDNSKTIEELLKLAGRKIKIVKDADETELYAVIEQTYKRNKSRFEELSGEIGLYRNDYCFYYGPASFDITSPCEDEYILDGEEKYIFIKKERVKVNDTLQYYRAVIKKSREADGNAFTG
ncbi:MAG: hypothetical protein IJT65_05070 [Eubacterium sp.]|nr:hypothetical protein [Eubacterium sp.]